MSAVENSSASIHHITVQQNYQWPIGVRLFHVLSLGVGGGGGQHSCLQPNADTKYMEHVLLHEELQLSGRGLRNNEFTEIHLLHASLRISFVGHFRHPEIRPWCLGLVMNLTT